jgi:hypothetical protein
VSRRGLPEQKPHQVEERPCPTCGGIVRLYRDQDGGLLFAAPGQSLLQQERDEARRQLRDSQEQVVAAAEKGAELGWQAGYELARKRFSLGGRLLDLVMRAVDPRYRRMRERERRRGR